MNRKNRSSRRSVSRHLWSVFALTAALTAPVAGQEGGAGDVTVTDYGTVTLTVKDTDLAQVLEMLSIQSRKNIITSKSVSATISANLYDVTFYEALDAILRVNGYGYIEEGNFIYVYTQDELEAIEALARQTDWRTYTLEYLSAIDAAEFIAPLLSDAGESSYRGEAPGGFKPGISDGGADSYAWTPRIVVNDYPEVLDNIGRLLEDLDTPPQQVLVEAAIVQTTLDESNAWGIDFAILSDLNFTDLANPLSYVTDLLAGSADGVQPEDNRSDGLVSSVGNTSGPGGLKIGILHDDFAFFMKVLDEVTDTSVLARPKIMCLNRQRAEVLVGARVGYLSTTATETTTTQTVEFLDTGIQLVFRPFISNNGMIRMELAPSVSEASLRTVTDSNGLLVTIPDELTNELTTNVRVRDGQTLVLGGLFRERTTVSRRQVPILGDVPLIGPIFQGQDDVIDREEIMFLLTPTIIDDETLWELGEDSLVYADAVRVGGRNGLLPFSRERLTDNHNRAAMEAYNHGDFEKALYYVNQSLRLNENQPEMIKFREQITGAREMPHEDAVLERALRREIGLLTPAQHKPEMGLAVPGMAIQGPSMVPAAADAGTSPWPTSPAPTTGSTTRNTTTTTTGAGTNQTTTGTMPQVQGTATLPAGVTEVTPGMTSTGGSDELPNGMLRSYFRNLELPQPSDIETGQVAGATDTEGQEESAETPFTTFDDVIEVVEVTETDEIIDP